MVYVFDTSSFIVIGHYYPQQFPSFWNKFDQAVAIGDIISVREVFRELDQNASAPHLSDWTEHHKSIFMVPNTAATQFVRTIFLVPHFQTLVSDKNRLVGRPCADPFIIALAKVMNTCVVTEEKERPNAAKIPQRLSAFWDRLPEPPRIYGKRRLEFLTLIQET